MLDFKGPSIAQWYMMNTALLQTTHNKTLTLQAISMHELQRLVSFIPAAYYANLECEQGRCYLDGFLVDDKTSTTGRSRFVDKE